MTFYQTMQNQKEENCAHKFFIVTLLDQINYMKTDAFSTQSSIRNQVSWLVLKVKVEDF